MRALHDELQAAGAAAPRRRARPAAAGRGRARRRGARRRRRASRRPRRRRARRAPGRPRRTGRRRCSAARSSVTGTRPLAGWISVPSARASRAHASMQRPQPLQYSGWSTGFERGSTSLIRPPGGRHSAIRTRSDKRPPLHGRRTASSALVSRSPCPVREQRPLSSGSRRSRSRTRGVRSAPRTAHDARAQAEVDLDLDAALVGRVVDGRPEGEPVRRAAALA